MSPKQAMATPIMTGMTAFRLAMDTGFFSIMPMPMVKAGTSDRITWLKFTETYRSETFPMAMLSEKMTENPKMYFRPLASSSLRVMFPNSFWKNPTCG